MLNDLRSVLRVAQERQGQPSAVILDGRTLQSTCESGPRAGYDGHKRKRGSKVHMAVDTLGLLLAVHIAPANEQERVRIAISRMTTGNFIFLRALSCYAKRREGITSIEVRI